MHKCKSIRNNFVELAGDEIPSTRAERLLAEVNSCAACREEYAAVRRAVHVSGQALRSTLPAETFWPAYQERLKSRLASSQEQNLQTPTALRTSLGSRLLQTLRSFASSSVRVPVPAALALLLLLGAAFFVVRPKPQAIAAAVTNSLPVTEIRTVEVPVIKEKVITRVVYVERKVRRGVAPEDLAAASPANALALRNASDHAPLSLVDFKPADEVKLTVIKSGFKDEKR